MQRRGPVRGNISQDVEISNNRALIARFFSDLRRALRLTVPQAAYYLQVHADVIEALETGQVEYLPPWPDTARIVVTYASIAGIDGRPALNAIGALIAELSHKPAAAQRFMVNQPVAQRQIARQPQPQQSMAHYADEQPEGGNSFLRAGSAIANGARRLPQQAVEEVRRRPQRALYALSLPLGILLVTMHSTAYGVVAKPFGDTVRWVSGYFQERFAPVRDGMRYIEVEDPRSRRADKLQIGGGSY